MIRTQYIYKRDGTYRVVSKHVMDPSDPPAVQAQFARHPPGRMLRVVVQPDERAFPDKLAPETADATLAAAFVETKS